MSSLTTSPTATEIGAEAQDLVNVDPYGSLLVVLGLRPGAASPFATTARRSGSLRIEHLDAVEADQTPGVCFTSLLSTGADAPHRRTAA